MGLPIDFPENPHQQIHPDQRWFPGADTLENVYGKLLPPLVDKVRRGVHDWRSRGYAGASATTRALLNHWFNERHIIDRADGTQTEFTYYFAQREAVESAIWLYEIQQARDPYSLIRFDSSGRLATGMFAEDWTRYVLKLATGAGKTKILSLLIAWSYFHRRYENESELATNFLLIAPNIIVLERLREDFDGLRIFYADPVLPPNGYDGRDWQNDFQVTLHIQDDIGHVSPSGNLFLTNIHRVYERGGAPSLEDADLTDFFLGVRPRGQTHEGQVDLRDVVDGIDELVVLNDEAHHLHDPTSAWFTAIRDISARLRQKGGKLAAQFDVSATPKDAKGGIFPQIVADYPLVEAIRQNVVKTPVLPDTASRGRLKEQASDDPSVRYRDYIHLGYLEWKKRYDELAATGKKPILFVMASDTSECDDLARHLERTYPELADSVLTIHTKKDGSISEADSNKSELDKLREASRNIDSANSPYKAIVSVLMLREGWDVQNVVSMVGLRPYTSDAKILPEQTLGRGLRRMFREDPDLEEYVSVVGTDAFMEFVESIREEGVELQYVDMGDHTPPKTPLVIEVDHQNPDKDIKQLDIELPVLTPRIQREYKNLESLDVGRLRQGDVELVQFSEEQQREIVFQDIDTEEVAWVTDLGTEVIADASAVVAFFTNAIVAKLHLVSGHDVLYKKVKEYIETRLFTSTVDVDDPNVLRNLSEPAAHRKLLDALISGINALTIEDTGSGEVRHHLKLSGTRPFVVKQRPHIKPTKSIFNRLVGDNPFELELAKKLDSADDIVSFARNDVNTHFQIEYMKSTGDLGYYRPDFIVKQDDHTVWIIEAKGRQDLDVLPKWERLVKWCDDATAGDPNRRYRPLFVRYDEFEKRKAGLRTFGQLLAFAEFDEPDRIVADRMDIDVPSAFEV